MASKRKNETNIALTDKETIPGYKHVCSCLGGREPEYFFSEKGALDSLKKDCVNAKVYAYNAQWDVWEEIWVD